jgi:hypothetical protein
MGGPAGAALGRLVEGELAVLPHVDRTTSVTVSGPRQLLRTVVSFVGTAVSRRASLIGGAAAT